MIKTESCFFYIVGENYTQLVRNFWSEGSIEKAKILVIDSMLVDGKPVLTNDDFLEIVTGKAKFVGSSKDDTLTWDNDDVNDKDISVNGVEHMLCGMLGRAIQKRNEDILYFKGDGLLQEEIEKEIKPLDDKIKNLVKELKLFYEITKVPETWMDEILTVNGFGVDKKSDIEKLEKKEYEENRPILTSIIGKWDGWLSPKGDFYESDPRQHIQLASDLFEYKIVEPMTEEEEKDFHRNEQAVLELRGWIKLSGGRFECSTRFEDRLTQSQKDKIFDWTTNQKTDEVYVNGVKLTLKQLFENNLKGI